MVYFLCIILLPAVFLTVMLIFGYRNGIFSIVRDNAEESLNLINYNLDQQFIDYESLTSFIAKDMQIQDLSRCSAPEYNADDERKRQTALLLDFYRSSATGVNRIAVCYENGMMLCTGTSDAENAPQQDTKWYSLCRAEQDRVHVLYYDPNKTIYRGMKPVNAHIITVCRALHDSRGNFIGAVNIEMYSQILKQSMANILSRNGSYVYVLDHENQIVYSPIVGVIPASSREDDYVVVRVFNERNQWTITGMIPMADYLQQIHAFSSLLIMFLVLLTVIMFIVSVKTGESIVRPIEKLRNLMKQVGEGDLNARFTLEGPEEIQDLGSRFNTMIGQLDENTKQVYIEQRAKRKAEMAALQANIKPHFLYNTLDTIHWMAQSYHAKDIVETVDALSTLFRVSLSKGSETIPISQEILHVKSYLQIQKVRYEDMLSYDIQAASDCAQLSVQKLILQPLVENAIYHGIKESGRNGHISIRVWRQDDSIYLVVEDDGAGMSPERLAEVRASLADFKPHEGGAYGLVNVHQRIRFNYGGIYGLYLESELNGGTTALIVHPII